MLDQFGGAPPGSETGSLFVNLTVRASSPSAASGDILSISPFRNWLNVLRHIPQQGGTPPTPPPTPAEPPPDLSFEAEGPASTTYGGAVRSGGKVDIPTGGVTVPIPDSSLYRRLSVVAHTSPCTDSKGGYDWNDQGEGAAVLRVKSSTGAILAEAYMYTTAGRPNRLPVLIGSGTTSLSFEIANPRHFTLNELPTAGPPRPPGGCTRMLYVDSLTLSTPANPPSYRASLSPLQKAVTIQPLNPADPCVTEEMLALDDNPAGTAYLSNPRSDTACSTTRWRPIYSVAVGSLKAGEVLQPMGEVSVAQTGTGGVLARFVLGNSPTAVTGTWVGSANSEGVHADNRRTRRFHHASYTVPQARSGPLYLNFLLAHTPPDIWVEPIVSEIKVGGGLSLLRYRPAD